jgi:hypothetical protein
MLTTLSPIPLTPVAYLANEKRNNTIGSYPFLMAIKAPMYEHRHSISYLVLKIIDQTYIMVNCKGLLENHESLDIIPTVIYERYF